MKMFGKCRVCKFQKNLVVWKRRCERKLENALARVSEELSSVETV